MTELFDAKKLAQTKAKVEAYMARAPYNDQADGFLHDHAIKFYADQNVYKCPPFCEVPSDQDYDRCPGHGLGYTIRFVKKSGVKSQSLRLHFWASRQDYLDGREPTAYDVLACITKNPPPDSFADFCAESGYDFDSRKAEAVYKAVVREWKKVKKFFTKAELAELQEIN